MSQSKNHNRSVVGSFCCELKELVYKKISDLSVEAWVTPEPVIFDQKTTGVYKKVEQGASWGNLWDCAWMHVTGKVPSEGKGKRVVLRVDVSGEGCVFDLEGNPVRGITTYASDFEMEHGMPVKRVIDVTNCSSGEEDIDLWIDAACNDLFGRLRDSGKLMLAEICTCDEELRQLYYDFKFLLMLCENLDDNSTIRNQIEYTLYHVARAFGEWNPEKIASARQQLAYHLNMKNEDQSFLMSAVGHAHIDLAWLWPIRETKRKGIRTFATALRMMEKYPDYIFGASQPQLYDWVKQDQPGLFEEIKQRVEDGRWECQGAMWVEPDTNVSGGEALVRQVLYGKKFFKEEFDKEIRQLWLPDVFGYSAALPQILKKSDVPYFMTIKLSWNEHNKFPHNTFIWQGIDGSEVLAHMPPEDTYNSGAMPKSLKNAEREFKDKDVSNEALLLFGIGDGGGGPSTDHLEYLKREKSIAGLPPVKQEHSIAFFDRINKDRDKYSKWCGELYLEKHQGTYTTQADNKKYNRLLELSLRDCEFSCSMASILAEFDYPQDEIETIWKEVLLYQFHDILPGSSIKRVYDESVERYKIMYEQVLEITNKANQVLANKLNIGENQTALFNTLPWERTETVEINGELKQVIIPAYGYKVVDNNSENKKQESVLVEKNILENEYLKAEFNQDGTIKSIFDKQAEREILNQSKTLNNLVIYEDKGDCWDIPFIYMDKAPESLKVVGCEVVSNSESKKIEFTYEYNKSKVVQKISLPEGSKKLVFDVDADWQETFKMLRGLYPIDVQTDYASCNIQFGHLTRPTHQNTSWDYAKIEVCAHKWVDLSEKNYGVAIINDSKYGYNVWDNVLNIDLLRSQMYPGVDADKGQHSFSYELFVHDGDLLKVNEEAYKFNIAPLAVKGSAKEASDVTEQSLIQVSSKNVVLEALKLAEDKSGYILRLYECDGQRTKANISFKGAKSAELTNMIERTEEELPVVDEAFSVSFKPFEIQTIKVKF
ncbi:MAG: alpha-mannosidase [Oscillospiraceae bacterium]|nr:alpha-mannosidase [Oscillospiraceae bacterium]